MALTTAQAQALATAIAGDATLAGQAARNEFPSIAAAMNAVAVPAVTLWRPDVPTSALLSAIAAADMPTTAGLIGWVQMMLSVGTVDATSAVVRAGFSAALVGKTATLSALTTASQRAATRFEALFTAASVSTAYGVIVSAADVQQALGK